MAGNFADDLLTKNSRSERVALVGAFGSVTYADLMTQIDALSTRLREIIPKRLIGLYADNSPFFVASYVAILRSGHAVALLDVKSPPSEISDLVSRHGISVVLSSKERAKKISSIPGLSVFTSAEDVRAVGANEPTRPKDLAVVIFTSGSSGPRKGVMLSHANLSANTDSILDYLKLTANDRCAVVMPFSYSYGLSILNTHLKVGGSLFLHESPFVGSVVKDLDTFSCTGMAAVPGTYRVLATKTPLLSTKFRSLRYMTQAGGRLDPKTILEIARAHAGVDFYVMYGATEATARISYLPPTKLDEKIGSIGVPIAGVSIEVTDNEGRQVNRGEVGELRVRGPNVMMGYLDDGEATKSVLKNGALLTGDLGYEDADGFYFVTGRKSAFVKSMGFRVNPHTVEERLMSSPSVESACVLGYEDPGMGEVLLAIVQLKSVDASRPDDTKRDLMVHCASGLASYEVPFRIEIIDNMPVNSNGKIDSAKLRRMFVDGA